jgi:hypothetical protein
VLRLIHCAVDDSSPLMRYEGFWVDASSNFSEKSEYRDQTYHAADNVPVRLPGLAQAP